MSNLLAAKEKYADRNERLVLSAVAADIAAIGIKGTVGRKGKK